LVATVDWVALAELYLLSAGQVAVSEQVPVPLVMVMSVCTFEQEPLLVITAVVLALVVDATVKVP
jgi:hypothetical protein